MRLLIDAGNTRTKWAWCPAQPFFDATWEINALDNTEWLQGGTAAQRLHQAVAEAEHISLSLVAGSQWLQPLGALTPRLQSIQPPATALGLHNVYHRPAQLGSDRWCSLVAVWRQYGQSALIATAGTALTLDALVVSDAAAKFTGGTIQPGLRLMWQSLQQGAAQLDYAYPAAPSPAPGFAPDSQQAMWLGCLQALAASVASQFERLQALGDCHPLLVLSGGDAQLLHAYLPQALAAQAIIVDNLVLKGLAYLAEEIDQ